MIRRSTVFKTAALSLAISLAACSGGTPDPTPTPTPTPTVTPTPTPVSYASFPLTAATEFGTINAYTSYTGDPLVGGLVLGVAGVEGPSTRFRLAVLADPTAATTTNAQVLRENTEETRFTLNNGATTPVVYLVTPPATTTPEYVFTMPDPSATPTPGKTASGEFLNNTVATKVTTDTGLALLRTSYAAYLRADSTTGAHRITYGVWGYPTVASDMPAPTTAVPVATATYTMRVAGRRVTAAGVVRLSGTVTVNVNFGTGAVAMVATVNTLDSLGVPTFYGTFSGSGSIAVGATTFTGNFDASSPIPGNISGAFFGPQAAELGISFAASGTVTGTDTRLVGVVVGKKN